MKKLTLIIATGIFISGANAQITNNIKDTGKVGIGITVPEDFLHIYPHGAGGMIIGSTGGGAGGYTSLLLNVSADKSGYGALQVVKASGTLFGDFCINTNGGNVGIGNIAPSDKLDVTGNIHTSGKIYNGFVQMNTDGGLELGPTASGATSTPYIDFHYGTGTGQDYNVRIQNYADNTMAIYSSMASDPVQKDILLRVAGNITTKKLRVTATPWADFVFADNYHLPSLHEVETYIKANKHLQEIPSAAEVEKEGIDVGEMNKKLLQKVEELTLYLIQQQKMIEEQNKRITLLEKK